MVQALSGGADSAYNTAKFYLMVKKKLWQKEGWQHFFDELNSLRKKEDILSSKDPTLQIAAYMKQACHTYYLSTPNSSEDTRRAAKYTDEW